MIGTGTDNWQNGGAATLAILVLVCCNVAAANKPTTQRDDCNAAGCHDQYEKRAHAHEPAAEMLCDACHEAGDPKEHAFSLLEEEPDLCTTCHDSPTEEHRFAHGPAAIGACTACHDPHGGEFPAMQSMPTRDRCLKCHEPMAERIEIAEQKHKPVLEDCTGCHGPHGGVDRFNLNATVPDLCIGCHEDIGETIKDAVVDHQAVDMKRKCLNCHAPHGSNVESLLADAPMKLCLQCHEQSVESDGKQLLGIGAVLAANTFQHGPIRDENCTDCHSDVHGSERFRLLVDEYPSTFYAPFDEDNQALCFLCHDSDLVHDDRTTTLTGFRNGNRNLHYLHVNREKKGRTCRACHDPHASSKPRHLTKGVPFGDSGWVMPLRYEKTDTGGSCRSSCHKQYSYDRENSVVNIAPLPKPVSTPAAPKSEEEQK
jgi:predicted CXXCH cytochrome family protein